MLDGPAWCGPTKQPGIASLKTIIGSEILVDENLRLVNCWHQGRRALYRSLSPDHPGPRGRAGKGAYRVVREDPLGGTGSGLWSSGKCVKPIDHRLPTSGLPTSEHRPPRPEPINRLPKYLKCLFRRSPIGWALTTATCTPASKNGLVQRTRDPGKSVYKPSRAVACGDVRMDDGASIRALLDVLHSASTKKSPRPSAVWPWPPTASVILRDWTTGRTLSAAWLAQNPGRGERCDFSMDRLGYRFRKELAPAPLTLPATCVT